MRLPRLETYVIRMGQQNQRVSISMVPRAIPKDVVKLLVALFDESGMLTCSSHYPVLATR